MPDRSPLEVAQEIDRLLKAMHAIEDEAMRHACDFGKGPESCMQGFFRHIDAAHKQAERAVRQIAELAPYFGSK